MRPPLLTLIGGHRAADCPGRESSFARSPAESRPKRRTNSQSAATRSGMPRIGPQINASGMTIRQAIMPNSTTQMFLTGSLSGPTESDGDHQMGERQPVGAIRQKRIFAAGGFQALPHVRQPIGQARKRSPDGGSVTKPRRQQPQFPPSGNAVSPLRTSADDKEPNTRRIHSRRRRLGRFTGLHGNLFSFRRRRSESPPVELNLFHREFADKEQMRRSSASCRRTVPANPPAISHTAPKRQTLSSVKEAYHANPLRSILERAWRNVKLGFHLIRVRRGDRAFAGAVHLPGGHHSALS